MPTEVFEVEGHIIDSLILAKVLDAILDSGAEYRIVDVQIGRASTDASRARIEVEADDDVLTTLATELQLHGA
ncbi:MAG: TIGR00300 family protein, partial [Acidimicrobiia bacterium]|nr:TIGR00300 family protein [Acidimicrobiia bacterium]